MLTNYTGVSGSRIAYFAAAELKQHKKALIVVSSERVAKRLRDDLAFFVPEAEFSIMPEEDDVKVVYEARDKSRLADRIKGIEALLSQRDEIRAVIAPVSAVLRRTCPPARMLKSVFRISTGDVVDPSDVRNRLVESGYKAVSVCESAGEFSARGGIIDIFAPAMEYPVRIEFWGDEVDSIRSFEPDSQRSIENLKYADITPAAEFIPTDDEIKKASKKLKDNRLKEIFESRSDVQIYSEFIELFDIDKTFLYDYAADSMILVCDQDRIIETVPEYQNIEDFYPVYKMNTVLYTPFPENVKGSERLDHVFNVRCRQVAAFNGQMDLLVKEIELLDRDGFRIEIVSSQTEKNERIKEYLDVAECHVPVTYSVGQLSSGMIFDDYKLCYIAETDIFPNNRKTSRKKKKAAPSISFSDLHEGDYVVHEVHGIGKFCGIKSMTTDGMTRDYLMIKYAGTDVLYIPTEQLDIIQKYIGSKGEAPSLSRLSGGSWKKTRDRVRKAVMEIAEDLVKLYAQREAAGGYAFPKDSLWQREFEEEFPYTETDDQLRSIEEIKKDMEKPIAMDRLLCGDVGFGKTEVAARAIFKCISEGKQAAFLAPTTLLVNQHYHNILERFGSYPFEIRMLSRFKTEAEQNKTIKQLKEGTVDLVIGTHRLLSDDVEFKDLGLVIIDEEQRFGVKHKEKLKKLKNRVDVLTLSATPIPRT